MPDAIWIDRQDQLQELAQTLAQMPAQAPAQSHESEPWIGVDTEFLRERTFFPKLCLLQLAAAGRIWCVDTLRVGSLDPLMPVLTAAGARKVIHAARQDLEAVYLSTKRVMSPIFDTQIAAGCIGLKPQVGYAELVKTLLDVVIPKGQTRTDWSKRPLTREQLEYAADDVLYLGEVANRLSTRLRELGREHWVAEDCLALEDRRLYEPDPAEAWGRLRGLAQLSPASRVRAKAIAVWREKIARSRDLPRAWILPDPAIYAVAEGAAPPLNDALAASLTASLEASLAAGQSAGSAGAPEESRDDEAGHDARPSPEQRAVIERLSKIVDARAAELEVSAEILAPRGELKALAMGRRESHALNGWRREEIGTRLIAALH
jgi:ribonuclease D